jgi:hypothetical protein
MAYLYPVMYGVGGEGFKVKMELLTWNHLLLRKIQKGHLLRK